MEKSVLRRLLGFLRDPFCQTEADPPSAGDPGDKGRPRLTAVEGGKGKEEMEKRGSDERTKPCAVIGIPYSSEPAEDTAEKRRRAS